MTDQIERALEGIRAQEEETGGAETMEAAWTLPGPAARGAAAGRAAVEREERRSYGGPASGGGTESRVDGLAVEGAQGALEPAETDLEDQRETGGTEESTALDWVERLAPGRGALEGRAQAARGERESFYHAARRARTAVEFAAARQRREDSLPQTERAGTAALGPEELDRLFQRDARRYDSGFPLY